MTKPNYYAVIPADVRYSKKLTPNAKLLYAEITALCNLNGKCTASTEYFCKLYEVSRVSIQKWLKTLEDNNYIKRVNIYKQGSKEILTRVITLVNNPRKQKLTDNTNINITNTNTTYSNKGKRFKKPSFNEVNNYCLERKNNIDAEAFIAFYESKGWMVGSNKMKNWKQAVITWEKNDVKTSSTGMSKIHSHLQKNINVKEKLRQQFKK
ncbi:MAG: DNA replication protein DnaD [Pusillimonas sp.]|nr:DNA replication protein DnaD [Pusillimonas sp.]